MPGYLYVLKKKDFLLLWLGQGVSDIGTKINIIGLTWLIIDLTRKASEIGLLFIVLTIPSIVVGSWSGVMVDRWNKKAVIVIADLARGILSMGMAFTDSLALIYVFALTQEIFTTFFSPAIQIAIPRLVEKEHLLTANALSSGTRHFAQLIGPASGGILIGLMGVKSAFIINGLSFIISAFSEMWIAIPHIGEDSRILSKQSFREEFKEGWKYIATNRVVKFVIVFFAIAMFPLGALPILNVVLVKEVLKFNAEAYGLLMTINGIGLLTGSLFIGKWGKNFNELTMIVLGASLYGASYIGLSYSTIFAMAALFFFTSGFVVTIVNISYGVYLQKAVEIDKQGRVFSIDLAIGNVVGLMSMWMAGSLADAFGTQLVIQFCGSFLVLQGLLVSNLKEYKHVLRYYNYS